MGCITILVELGTSEANVPQNRQRGEPSGGGKRKNAPERERERDDAVRLIAKWPRRSPTWLQRGCLFAYVVRYDDGSSPSRGPDGPREQEESPRPRTHRSA